MYHNSQNVLLDEKWKQFDFKNAAQRYAANLREKYCKNRFGAMDLSLSVEEMSFRLNILSPSNDSIPQNHANRPSKILGEIIARSNRHGRSGIDVVKSCERLLLMGKPGAGKTAFLKYLMVCALAHKIDYIPVYIPLPSYAPYFTDSNSRWLDIVIHQFEICDFPEPVWFAEKILENGRAMILADGFSEIPDRYGLRKKVLEDYLEFTKTYPRNKHIVTCRSAAYTYAFEGFTHAELKLLNTAEIQDVVVRRFSKDRTAKKTFLKRLAKKENRTLRKWAKTPLTLLLLCLSFRENSVLPIYKSEILEAALNELLHARSSDANDSYLALSRNHKHALFAFLASQATTRRGCFANARQLEDAIASFLNTLPFHRMNGYPTQMVLDDIVNRYGIVQRRFDGAYAFTDPVFRDFYLARYITRHMDSDFSFRWIQDHLMDPDCSEIFVLIAEMSDPADRFFEMVFSVISGFKQRNTAALTILEDIEKIIRHSGLDKYSSPRKEKILRWILSMISQMSRAYCDSIYLARQKTRICSKKSSCLLDDAVDIAHHNVLSVIVDCRLDTECNIGDIIDTALDSVIGNRISMIHSIDGIFEKNLDIAFRRVSLLFRRILKRVEQERKEGVYRPRVRMIRDFKKVSVQNWCLVVDDLLASLSRHFRINDFSDAMHRSESFIKYVESIVLIAKCLEVATLSDRDKIERQQWESLRLSS